MNWGHKLILVFGLFACGMLYLVYRSMKVNTDLVNKEYYKDELRYQEVIDGTKSADSLSSEIEINQQNKMITIQLPVEMKNRKIAGSIWFYCAANAGNDRHILIELNNDALQRINKNIFYPGQYTVKFDWFSDSKHYHSEQPLIIL